MNVHVQNMSVSSRANGKFNPLFKMFSHIFSVIAEQEREQNKERTEMGKAAARQKGIVFGRKQGSNERKVDFLGKEAKLIDSRSILDSSALSNFTKAADGTRSYTYTKVQERAFKPEHYLLPIPRTEINRTSLTQNPGYN